MTIKERQPITTKYRRRFHFFTFSHSKRSQEPQELWRSPLCPWPDWAEQQIEKELAPFTIPTIPNVIELRSIQLDKKVKAVETFKRQQRIKRLRESDENTIPVHFAAIDKLLEISDCSSILSHCSDDLSLSPISPSPPRIKRDSVKVYKHKTNDNRKKNSNSGILRETNENNRKNTVTIHSKPTKIEKLGFTHLKTFVLRRIDKKKNQSPKHSNTDDGCDNKNDGCDCKCCKKLYHMIKKDRERIEQLESYVKKIQHLLTKGPAQSNLMEQIVNGGVLQAA